jgi:hypothetical protein
MLKKTNFFVMLVIFFLVSCTSISTSASLEDQYISDAQKITDQYGVLKPTITLASETSQDSQVIYHIEIRSDYFANQFDAEHTYLYLNDLYQIIDNTNPRTSPIVYSGDRVYKLNFSYARAYTVNDHNVFPSDWYGTSSVPTSSSQLDSGGDVVSLYYGGVEILCGITEQDFKDIVDAIVNKDDVGFNQIFTSGRGFIVDSGTKALVLEKHLTAAKVRIMEGPYSGQIGWVTIEAVSK